MFNKLKHLIPFFLFVIPFVHAQDVPKQKVTIQFEFPVLAGKEIILAYPFWNKTYVKDTLRLDAYGKNLYTPADGLEPGMYYIVVPPENKYVTFLVDNEPLFAIKGDPNKATESFSFTQSPINTKYYNYLRFIEGMKNQIEAINADVKLGEADKIAALAEIEKKVDERQLFNMGIEGSLLGKIIELSRNPELEITTNKAEEPRVFYAYREAYFKTIDVTDMRLLRTPMLAERINYFLDELVVKQPDSILTYCHRFIKNAEKSPPVRKVLILELLNKYAKQKYIFSEDIYAELGKAYYSSGQANWIDKDALKKITDNVERLLKVKIGVKAPNFNLPDRNFKYYSLHSLTAKGFVLYFYSTDCGKCARTLPKLSSAEKKYRSSNIKFITILVNSKDEVKINEVFTKYEMSGFLNLLSRERNIATELYNFTSYPGFFVLDAKHIILSKRFDVDQLEQVLDSHF